MAKGARGRGESGQAAKWGATPSACGAAKGARDKGHRCAVANSVSVFDDRTGGHNVGLAQRQLVVVGGHLLDWRVEGAEEEEEEEDD